MKKRILITGGAGFLGSHLCERLLKEGNEVICVDNLLTGSKENIRYLLENRDFKFIEHDIIAPLDIEVHEIYNLACPASPVHYQRDPIHTIKTNIIGSMNMLEIAKKYKAKILQASTSEIYGDPHMHPQSEEYRGNVNSIGPRACYDEGKRCSETLFFDYHRKYDLNIKVVRIFNTYGPRMSPRDGRVVSNFIIQALRNKDITVYGDGRQTRSFCYVKDLISGLIKMMESKNDILGPMNLGNPEEYSVLQLANKIICLTKSNSKIVYKPLPQDDPVRRKPDIKKAKDKLNWTPETKLDDGLKNTIEYFKKIIL
ncbi:UDP-glucuronic acid decarboxylase family protein [Maledivibacter halophilus]|uniref:UDP-glucuronate decarboxylase n=1 Tax=Maledivibacter halophilus TaxID=36842 RepID=A0A1T5L3G2_9FIRM|nr:UDP-glucuronic acid decarboxylase family protein [Maledivibacter halophilus]SKC69938.1 UDP-glucuronate decarboxylase [Maledivibacter halophilus]